MSHELMVPPKRAVARAFDAALIADWQADMALRVDGGELSPDTAKTYKRAMDKFMAWTTEHEIERVEPNAVRQWKAALLQAGHKERGVNTWLAGVKHFFNWAVTERGLAYDPAQTVKSAKREHGVHARDALSQTEIRRVLDLDYRADAIGRRDRAIVYIMAYTGCRRVELHRADIADIRTNAKTRLVLHGKGGADRAVYVHPEAEMALYDWLAVHPRGDQADAPLFVSLGNRNRGQRLSRRAITMIVRARLAAAGVRSPRKTMHSIRHSVVTQLLRDGHSIPEVMSVTGHKDPKTLLGYYHEMTRDADPIELHLDW